MRSGSSALVCRITVMRVQIDLPNVGNETLSVVRVCLAFVRADSVPLSVSCVAVVRGGELYYDVLLENELPIHLVYLATPPSNSSQRGCHQKGHSRVQLCSHVQAWSR